VRATTSGGARRAEIARQHGVDLGEQAERLEALDQRRDRLGRRGRAAKRAVAGMVREPHRVDRPDLVAEQVEGQQRGLVADVAEGDRRLDREHVHASTFMQVRS